MALAIDFARGVIDEARRARRWYARRSPSVASRFVAALDAAIARASQMPQACSPHLHGTRMDRVGRFPYWVVFVEEPHRVLVVAVMHAGRRPGYWRRRLP